MAATKTKVSLTLSTELVARIDRDARRLGTTRSYLVEAWLRSSASRAAERDLEEATAAYYATLRGPAKADEEAIARASSRAAKLVTYDEPRPRSRRK
jgi:metal-responsive CopG/Arc/MetJ family transcriptional regulator